MNKLAVLFSLFSLVIEENNLSTFPLIKTYSRQAGRRVAEGPLRWVYPPTERGIGARRGGEAPGRQAAAGAIALARQGVGTKRRPLTTTIIHIYNPLDVIRLT